MPDSLALMEVLVTWDCPRCGGTDASNCGLCDATGRVERWLPLHLVSELRVKWTIRARRSAPAMTACTQKQGTGGR
jgi:hypothetical protein